MRLAGTIAILVCITAPVRPQAQDSGPAIRVTVDLVQVDAVVTDAKGGHIADLKPEDFRIFEDGKPQKITHFSLIEAEKDQSARSPAAHHGSAPAGSPVFIGVSPAPPRRSDIQRTLVLLADDLGLSADDIPAVRSAMKNFVDREMQPGDLVSIMTSSRGMGASAQLTSDKRQIYASIGAIHYVPGRTGLTWYVPVRKFDAASRYESEVNKRLAAVRNPFVGAGTASALSLVIQGLREMPGRKAIALFSDGLPQSAGGIIEMANRASVSIYTFDPRGLASFYMTAVDHVAPALADAEQAAREAAYRASQRSLEELARGTAGLFFHDNNDLDRGLTAALNDMSSYYLIGYQPHRDDFDLVHGRPRYHTIEVKVLRPGLHVRSRAGFAGVPDSATDSPARSGADQLRTALFSPFQANGFPVQLSAFHSAPWNNKTKQRTAVLRAMLAIDAHALSFADAPNGRKRLSLEIAAGLWDGDNKVAASSDKTFSDEMTTGEANDLAASGLLYGFDMVLPKPGPYQLRIAARDVNSGHIGSAYTFVEVPDFRRAALALSSITLRNPGATGSAITRVFAPGAKLSYDSAVFGEIVDHSKSAPKLDMEIRLFRGSEHVFSSPPILVPAQQPPEIHAAGEIRIPPAMAPGSYAVELLVYDPQQKRGRAAEEWTDFTLVNPAAAK